MAAAMQTLSVLHKRARPVDNAVLQQAPVCARVKPGLNGRKRRVAPLGSQLTQAPQAERASVPSSASVSGPTVAEVMTCARIYTVYPNTTVDDALQLICQHRVSGLPVVDTEGKVVGIVSDYDLLNLEGILQEDKERGLFPPVDECWSTFKSIRTLLDKTGSKFVEDVMTRDPFTVKPHVHVDEAAKMLMTKCVRRLPVVDDEGRLVGVLSRGNIVRAVLKAHMAGRSVDQA